MHCKCNQVGMLEVKSQDDEVGQHFGGAVRVKGEMCKCFHASHGRRAGRVEQEDGLLGLAEERPGGLEETDNAVRIDVDMLLKISKLHVDDLLMGGRVKDARIGDDNVESVNAMVL